MIDTRLILVDGLPGTGRTRLAQQLSVQLGAAGVEHDLHHRNGRGHPLLRPWDPQAYSDGAAYARTLVLQWENFAIRSAAEGRPALFDAALLHAPAALLEAGAVDMDAAQTLARDLLGALEPLAPVLLYLWRAEAGSEVRRQLGDGVFGRLAQRRALLNFDRSTADQRLADALSFLGVPRQQVALAPELAARLRGRYGAPGGALDEALLELTGAGTELRVAGQDGDAGRALLPTTDGRLLVAGRDLALHPNLGPDGSVLGLLVETGDPALATLPEFLPRLPH